ncbi:MAG: UMP kinase [Bifidobacteriaceae bacterium]|nr:UMP kinase [Bifidobacteriaceae bacterium]
MKTRAFDNEGNPVRRVLLKISGEAFGGGELGIDTEILQSVAAQIKTAKAEGVQVCVVVGGGNFFRGKEMEEAGLDRSRGDYIGMLGTVMNCLALQDFLEQVGIDTRVQTAIAMGQIAEPYIPLKAIAHMKHNKVVIFGAGAGLPYFSTDTVSIQRALETHCEIVLMGKNGVDGVYDDDPRKNPQAKKYDILSLEEAITKDLKVMDGAALSLARENHMDIRVFGLDINSNVALALLGEPIGTLVTESMNVSK